ncbi:MAG: Gfo/Idh/MocA family protein [Anaerolineae bacterium]
MSEIGIGIIGYGFIGRIHAASYQAVPWMYPGAPRARLLAVCTATADSARKAQAEGEFPLATTDYRELLGRDDIQAISCCTPNDSHREILLAAIEAGKHIYCDKPLALNLAEAHEVVAAAKGRSCIYQMTFEYRFVPALLRAKQLIQQGFLGQLFSFRACYLHAGYIDPQRPMSWRLDWQRSGGGAVVDLGAHVIDLVRYLAGEFRSVLALQRTYVPERPAYPGGPMVPVKVDDITIAQAELSNGAVGTLEFSRLATGAEDELRLEFHGSQGALAFNLMEPNWLYAYDVRRSESPIGGERGWTRIATVGRYPEKGALPGPKFGQGWMRFHIASAHAFLQNVAQGKLGEESPLFADGLAVQVVIDAMQRSALTGQWVSLR